MTKAEFVSTVANDWELATPVQFHISYDAFIWDTIRLFECIPLDIKFSECEPFLTFEELIRASKLGKMLVCTKASNLPDGHPLSQKLLYTINRYGGRAQTFNTLARAVHDYYGHVQNGLDFSFVGEVKAYRIERSIYSPASLPAMYSEAIGQLCYYCQNSQFVPVQKPVILPIRDVDSIEGIL